MNYHDALLSGRRLIHVGKLESGSTSSSLSRIMIVNFLLMSSCLLGFTHLFCEELPQNNPHGAAVILVNLLYDEQAINRMNMGSEDNINEITAKLAVLKIDHLDALSREMKDVMHKYYDPARIRSMITDTYAKTFTVSELGSLIAFYQTPIGKQLIAKTPQINQSIDDFNSHQSDLARPEIEAVVNKYMGQDEPQNYADSGVIVGKAFPHFISVDSDNKSIDTSTYKGRYVLIDFWATWCRPCVGSIPGLQKLYDTYHQQGFEIIGISLDEDGARLQAFIKDNHVEWPQIFDGKGWKADLAVKFNIHAIPSSILIGKNGEVIGIDPSMDTIESAIRK